MLIRATTKVMVMMQTLVMLNYETGEVVRRWSGHEREVAKLAYRKKAGEMPPPVVNGELART